MAGCVKSALPSKKFQKANLGTVCENKLSHLCSSTSDCCMAESKKLNDFKYHVTDFDHCQLDELDFEKVKECDICVRLKNKKIITRYHCSHCSVTCCPECYDFHHREQIILALRSFRKEFPPFIDIRISDDGDFFVVNSYSDMLADESPADHMDESKEFISSGILEKVVTLLEKNNASTEIMLSHDKKFRCLYFQDKQMKDFLNYYPEFICIDVTCEIVELELILYLFICEDTNKHCEIVSACLGKVDDVECLAWMFDAFKKHNPNWRKMRVLVADKQIQNQLVIRNAFPDASVLLSTFHTMRVFKRDISNKDLGITSREKSMALQLVEKMSYACTETEYMKLYQQFKSLPGPVVGYFDENWHRVKEEWTLGIKFNCQNILSPTNKFLLCVKRKIISAVNTQTSLEKIIVKFFSVLTIFRKERYYKIGAVIQTLPISLYSKFTPHHKYAKFLTCYGAELVIHQLNAASEIKNIQKISPGKYKIDCVPDVTTTTYCSCNFYHLVLLPCCHIFAVRKLLSLPLYVETLSSVRWINKYYQNTYLSLHAIFSSENENYLLWSEKQNQDLKFRKYFEATGQLLPLLLECSQETSRQRNAVLKQLLSAWKQNIKVSVKCVGNKLSCDNCKLASDEECSIAHLQELYGISRDSLESDDNFSSVSLCSEHSSDELLSCISDPISPKRICKMEDSKAVEILEKK